MMEILKLLALLDNDPYDDDLQMKEKECVGHVEK